MIYFFIVTLNVQVRFIEELTSISGLISTNCLKKCNLHKILVPIDVGEKDLLNRIYNTNNVLQLFIAFP